MHGRGSRTSVALLFFLSSQSFRGLRDLLFTDQGKERRTRGSKLKTIEACVLEVVKKQHANFSSLQLKRNWTSIFQPRILKSKSKLLLNRRQAKRPASFLWRNEHAAAPTVIAEGTCALITVTQPLSLSMNKAALSLLNTPSLPTSLGHERS